MTSTIFVLYLSSVFMSNIVGGTEQLVITADNIVNRVCVDGISKSLTNNKQIPKFDRVDLPGGWDHITVEGTNLGRGWAGFLAWQSSTTTPTALAKWRCMAMSEVPNGDCCTVATTDSGWRPSKDWYRINGHHNRNYKSKVPSSVTHWFWSNKIKQRNICCISQRCDNVCKKCTLPGLGNCLDCMFGSTTIQVVDPLVSLTPDPAAPIANVCKFKCCAELLCSSTSSPIEVVLTNQATGIRVSAIKTTDRRVIFWFDIRTCSIGEMYDTATIGSSPGTDFPTQLNMWNNDHRLRYFVGGEIDATGASPFMGVYKFDYQSATGFDQLGYGFHTSDSFCYTAYPGIDSGLVDSDVKTT